MQKNIGSTFAVAACLMAMAQAPLFAHGDKPHGEISPKALEALYSAYLEIQASLAKDDLESARKVGQEFLKQPVKFSTDLSHSVKAKDVLIDFKTLNGAKDIAAYRKAFSPFSDHMAVLMSEAKYRGGKAILEYECPMANDNKGGKWLQAEIGVANPYYGASMLTCGSLKKRVHEGSAKEAPKGAAKTPADSGHAAHH